MKKFTEQEINNYPILKELKPYTNNEEICSTISTKGLTNLKELMHQFLHNSEWWVKVAGKQSRTSFRNCNEVY